MAALLLPAMTAPGVLFTSDTFISPGNTNYDGMDIAVTNCTVTVDGPHSFGSLQVLDGGILTHTFDPSGQVVYYRTVANQPQVLSLTHAATLSGFNVLATSIVVQDLSGTITYTNDVDYVVGMDTNALTTLLLTTNSAIAEGSTNLVSYDVQDAVVATGIRLTATGDVWVARGGSIHADGKGYGGGKGYGAGQSSGSPPSGSGAGHGGYGGQSAEMTGSGSFYDSIQVPSSLGSGGGAGFGGIGGAGGGLVKLVVGGTLRVDGSLSANGADGLNARSGGGSGGTISLSAQHFTGTGAVSARGGAGEPVRGGGGAGGRIAVQYETSTFSGDMAAPGGSGYVCGGAGTIYTRATGQSTGQVLVANAGSVGAGTPLPTGEIIDLTVRSGAVIPLLSPQTLGRLIVGSNAWISPAAKMLTVTGNATIEAGGGITANGLGQGPGVGGYSSAGYTYVGGGGGHGGYGAAGGGTTAYGGQTYGNVTAPVDPGSGGGCYPPYGRGGAGGGTIRLNVTGMLLLNGTISADADDGLAEGSGGGSGGSVWLTVGTLAGSGSVSADGGMGNGFGSTGGGGGGGGRIAIEYGLNLFFGTLSARGGSGAGWGGAGTIYTKPNSQSFGHVLVDNGGQAGTNTTFRSFSLPMVDLTVKGGAVLSPPSSQGIGTLLVASNGWISVVNQVLSVNGDATIEAGGGIVADGTGYGGNQGPGAGRYYSTSGTYVGGGAGYGGSGAAGVASGTYYASGGGPYGSVASPREAGSGGGGSTAYATGGAGGGAIVLSVTGVLQLDGRISANGRPGVGPSTGGGSGGSVLLTAGTLAGSGFISANGGMGNYLGGGGAGGRIAVDYSVSAFTGIISAFGGGGYAWGGAGTVYTKATNQSRGQVIADNGGHSGTNTWLGYSSPATIDLTLKNGAVISPLPSQSLGTLLVASNGWLSMSNQTLTVQGNATIQAGGGIIADGTGYSAGQGPGAGGYGYSSPSRYVGGGAGYGGYGGLGALGGLPGGPVIFGGNSYGSVSSPNDRGSGGGGYPSYAMGGAGGGAIRITVTGVLQVDGKISAAGMAPSSSDGGGGSGGSIFLTVGSLAGSGTISANGGTSPGAGGGGGGGRIAIVNYSLNAFSGTLSAWGGGGSGRGGAGTIYTRGYNQTAGLLLVDNGGQSGTNTSFGYGSPGPMDLTVRAGGVLSLPSSQSFSSLLLASNGWLHVTSQVLTVNGNAIIQAGGGILADGTGYPGGQGPGAGKYVSTQSGYVGSGGGYGGYGASSGGTPAAAGGTSYGSVTAPYDRGSGGGGYGTVGGGMGGGAVTLNVTGTLTVDGRISAGGVIGTNANAGGGSGGTVRLAVGTLAGSGAISANGGAGLGLGGGGGGGRIAITCSGSTFAGFLSACGGGGYACGGAGTIYTRVNSRSREQVVVDNGGQIGTNTSLPSLGAVDLTVVNGATVVPQASQTFANLLVGSNAWVIVTDQKLTVTSNATVQPGGGIIADGTGYPGGQGPGAGRTFSAGGGGGGYGGYGAASAGATPAFGGSTYGSLTAPLDRGSGGGGRIPDSPSFGGAGGGAIHMMVMGVLLVNGRISANGGAGIAQGGGGGSGGSVWLMAGTLAGTGIVSANGGAGNEPGGGGGGGRVVLQFGMDAFEGALSACGGSGSGWGGAGTLYTKASTQTMGRILVDNCGHAGTNTPLPYLSPFDLTVSGGAVAYPSDPYLLLSNLFIASGGTLTCLATQTNLDVVVLRNATINADGLLGVDGKGFAAGTGPGAGLSTNSIGSGAGSGGHGGASSVMPGGATYGSVQQPTDRGSGGGVGWGTATGGSEGGGTIRLSVAGSLVVNGRVSAGGNGGLQDDAGGGSGGSIWLTAGALTGTGAIAADGGAGELYGGGGGGGGRIAIYTPLNILDGLVSVAGGAGASAGETGSVFYAASAAAPQVTSILPTGAFTSAVSYAEIVFDTPVDPYSVAAPNIGLTAPGGLAVSNLTVTTLSPYRYQIAFPAQIAQGDYALTVGPQVEDLLGQPMSQVHTGLFTIGWVAVQGSVTDNNGQPVPDVVLQPDGGHPATVTDTNGDYVLPLPPAGTVTVTPSKAGLVFVPGYRAYTDVISPLANQNYLAVETIVPTVSTQVETNSLILSWQGIPGVTYQPLCSTNLADWMPYDGVLMGTNGPLQLVVPMDACPSMFFRVGAGN